MKTSVNSAALTDRHDFTGAVLATAAAGGDNAARAAMIGACLGAHLGHAAFPDSWRTRLTAHDLIEGDLESIVRYSHM